MSARGQAARKASPGVLSTKAFHPVTPDGKTDWDAFQAHAYWQANYTFLRADDRRFLARLRDFFGDEAAAGTTHRRGVDVGSGTNLYPALAMLPLCDEITLLEYGATNCSWLTSEISDFSPQWDMYWEVLGTHPEYSRIGARRVRSRLARTAKVQKGSLYDLEPKTFDLGTMFFVAESITNVQSDFQDAVQAFITSLTPGAPFAAAFMRNSAGYQVKDHKFPAFQIDEDDLRSCLGNRVPDLELLTVDTRGQLVDAEEKPATGSTRPLRHGYDGMILALGHVG